MPLDEIGGKWIKIACVTNKVEHGLKVFRQRGRINSVSKHADRVEIVAHIEDISWAQLDQDKQAADEPRHICG